MDLVIKSIGALAILLALAGAIAFDQLLVLLIVGYLAVGNTIAISGPPVY